MVVQSGEIPQGRKFYLSNRMPDQHLKKKGCSELYRLFLWRELRSGKSTCLGHSISKNELMGEAQDSMCAFLHLPFTSSFPKIYAGDVPQQVKLTCNNGFYSISTMHNTTQPSWAHLAVLHNKSHLVQNGAEAGVCVMVCQPTDAMSGTGAWEVKFSPKPITTLCPNPCHAWRISNAYLTADEKQGGCVVVFKFPLDPWSEHTSYLAVQLCSPACQDSFPNPSIAFASYSMSSVLPFFAKK